MSESQSEPARATPDVYGAAAYEALDAVRLVAPLLTRRGRIALIVGPRDTWRVESGYTFVPLELAGGAAHTDESDEAAVVRLSGERLGRRVRMVASAWTYATSARHAIDRRAVASESGPWPLVELIRATPGDDESRHTLRRVVVRVYRCDVLERERTLTAGDAVWWVSPAALRAAVRGAPGDALLDRDDIECADAAAHDIPENAMIYCPSEFAERYLLRVLAKYGEHIIGGEKAPGTEA